MLPWECPMKSLSDTTTNIIQFMWMYRYLAIKTLPVYTINLPQLYTGNTVLPKQGRQLVNLLPVWSSLVNRTREITHHSHAAHP